MNDIIDVSKILQLDKEHKYQDILNLLSVNKDTLSPELEVLYYFCLLKLKKNIDGNTIYNSLQQINYDKLLPVSKLRYNDLTYFYHFVNVQDDFINSFSDRKICHYSYFLLLKFMECATFQANKVLFVKIYDFISLKIKQAKTIYLLQYYIVAIKGLCKFKLYEQVVYEYQSMPNDLLNNFNPIGCFDYYEALYKLNNISTLFDSLWQYEIKKFTNHKCLTIVCGVYPKTYLYYKRDFIGTVLYVSMKSFTSYYLYQPDVFIEILKGIIKAGNYEKIVTLGSSKSGFSALLIGALLGNWVATTKQDIKVFVTAFSPQSVIDSIFGIPSGKQLLRIINDFSFLKYGYQTYGNLAKLFPKLNLNNVTFNIVYGKGHKRDNQQANLLKDYANLYAIDTAMHSVICFIPPISNFSDQSLQKYYKAATTSEPDLLFLNNAEVISFEAFKKLAIDNQGLFDKVYPTLLKC